MANERNGPRGPVFVRTSSGGVVSSPLPAIEWPAKRKEVERKVLGYFVREIERTGAQVLYWKDSGAANLGFLLTLPEGKAWLALLEALAPDLGQTPLRAGMERHDCIDYAQGVFTGVRELSARYEVEDEFAAGLLLYVTREQDRPGDPGIAALRRMFLDRKHPFESAFFLVPLTEEHAVLSVLYDMHASMHDVPSLAELQGKDWTPLPAPPTSAWAAVPDASSAASVATSWRVTDGRRGYW
jgi:hypothetical protein